MEGRRETRGVRIGRGLQLHYRGGKFRQSKQITRIIKENHGTGFKYCEPFCGAMWSACRTIEECSPVKVVLSDINEHLMLFWREVIAGRLELPTFCTEETHARYKKERPKDDPLTAWYGVGASFGAGWFGAFARRKKGDTIYDLRSQVRGTMKKVEILRTVPDLNLRCCDYWDVLQELEDGHVVYLDPPYERRDKSRPYIKSDLNYPLFWDRVRKLGERHFVYVTAFEFPYDFETLYDWGNTTLTLASVVKSPRSDISERLVRWRG